MGNQMTDIELRYEIAKLKGWQWAINSNNGNVRLIHLPVVPHDFRYPAQVYWTPCEAPARIYPEHFHFVPNWTGEDAEALKLLEEIRKTPDVEVYFYARDTGYTVHIIYDTWPSEDKRALLELVNCTGDLLARVICTAWLEWTSCRPDVVKAN